MTVNFAFLQYIKTENENLPDHGNDSKLCILQDMQIYQENWFKNSFYFVKLKLFGSIKSAEKSKISKLEKIFILCS